ncbi:MAG TPA: hypothetical protein VFX29_05300, partial [Longimicrobiaceae bacterium]|nr:hypothetical protein [Longimicrobiaceae bacterium]
NRGRYLVNGELVVHLSGNPGIYRLTPFGLEGPLPGTAHVDWYKGIGADVLQQYRDTTPAPSVPEHYWWDYTPEGEDPGGDPDPGGGDPGGGGTPKPPVIPPATGGGDGTGYGDLAQGRRRVPLTIFGGAGTLFDFDNGHTDHGEPIRVALQFDPLVPAGAGGEAIFPCAYLTVTSSMEVTLTVTPILDGVAREAERQTIQVPGGTRRTTHHYEIPLYLAAAFGRFALRGTRLAVRIESPGIAPGDLIFDSVELEHETVRESKRPQ